jgi:hypothetical protein
MRSNQPYRRISFFAIAGLAFFALAASEPQCARVGDQVVSPDGASLNSNKGGVSQCVHACVDEAQQRRADEKDLHKTNIESCAGDWQCLQEEEARHESVMEQIAMDQRDCKALCHNQGGGHGGQ